MTSLAREEINAELLGAIQATIPSSESVRHCVFAFRVETDTNFVYDWQGNIIGEQEVPRMDGAFHLAVTDSMLAFRQLDGTWDLTNEQLQDKHRLKSEVYKRWPVKGHRIYSDEAVVSQLVSKYGELRWKWLPQVVWSFDLDISQVSLGEFGELVPSSFVLEQFRNFRHQKEKICFFEYSGRDWSQHVFSFFGNLYDIYIHIRDVKSNIALGAKVSGRITKCLSCGSAELTIRGSYTICDYCQSKF